MDILALIWDASAFAPVVGPLARAGTALAWPAPSMSKRRLARDDEWQYEGDHADDKADVEEWEAQADGTFTKLLKASSIDQLVKLNIDRAELMDEDEDEDEDEADDDDDPDDAVVGAGVQEREQDGEVGADDEVGDTNGGAAAATDAKEERPCKRPKMGEDEL